MGTASQVRSLSAGSEMVRPQTIKPKAQTATIRTELPPQETDKPWTIGVLLPLSGEYRTIGQRFQQGLELALTTNSDKKYYKWHLLLADSAKTTPEAAIKHFKDEHATIILGPIQSKLAKSAAEKAIEQQLPIILLAPQPQLTSLGENVFQHFLSAANQAREMARFIQERDEKRVALLHPDNNFGNDFKTTLINSCQNGQTSIIKSSTYNPQETDFRAAIKNLQETPDPTIDQPVPSYSFTALIIADFYLRLRLLAPQLAFHNLTESQIYGIHGGNDQRLENEAASNLEGAIFLDLCLNLPLPPQACTDYRKLYLKTYQEQPSIYDTYAYDTITIINHARNLSNNSQTTNLAKALLELPPLKLISGLTTVSQDGEFSKKLCPLIFTNKERHPSTETNSGRNKNDKKKRRGGDETPCKNAYPEKPDNSGGLY